MSEDKKFHAFLAGHFYLQELDTDKSAEGDYSDDEVQQAWEVWQGAREELATVTADRDVKAANLQLLVEKVLEIDTTEVAGDTEGYENAIYDAIQLARSLKQ